MISLTINAKEVSVPEGTTVAAAVMKHDKAGFRHSVSGEPRGALCGMGVCFECRVTIDGEQHRRSCTIFAEEGMEVVTAE